MDPLIAVKREGKRQQILRVAPAPPAGRADGYSGLAAGQQQRRSAIAGKPGMVGREIARFAFEVIAEDLGLESDGARAGRRGIERIGGAGNDPYVRRRQRLGRLIRWIGEMADDRRRRRDGMGREDVARFCERCRVGERRARCHRRRIVTWNVGDHQSGDARRRCGFGETPAFDRRQMFANAIDLRDGGTRSQQRVRHRLLIGKRQTGRRAGQQGRATARDQEQRQIVHSQT